MLTGICGEAQKADSCFSYAENRSQESLDVSGYTVLRQDVCTADLLGTQMRESTVMQKTRSGTGKNSLLRLILAVLARFDKAVPHRTETSVENLPRSVTFSSRAIIRYIHRQDGKKYRFI